MSFFPTSSSEKTQYGVYTIIGAIRTDTTPEELNELLARAQTEYDFTNEGPDGWSALGISALRGNAELIEHIVKIGGKSLLNRQNDHGWTPLFAATKSADTPNGFLAAKTLIDLGADPNLPTKSWCWDSKMGDIPEGATPLWLASEKIKNLPLVLLLLENRAIIPETLSPQATELIRLAQELIETSNIYPQPLDFF